MKNIITLLLILLGGGFVSAQIKMDTIYMTSGKKIEAKVVEINPELIKYKFSLEGEAVSYTVKVMDVAKIIFSDGRVETFRDELENPDLYTSNNKTAWKLDFLSPLYGFTAFSMEKGLRPGFSVEGTVGLIGLGNDLEDARPLGFHLKFGPRFKNTPTYRTGSLRYYHVLKGAYIQPQVYYGVYAHDVNSYSYMPYWPYTSVTNKYRTTSMYGGLQLLVGNQSVYSNRFCLDIYAGIGFGFLERLKPTPEPQSGVTTYEYGGSGRNYGIATLDNNNNGLKLSFSAGIKVGFLTK